MTLAVKLALNPNTTNQPYTQCHVTIIKYLLTDYYQIFTIVGLTFHYIVEHLLANLVAFGHLHKYTEVRLGGKSRKRERERERERESTARCMNLKNI